MRMMMMMSSMTCMMERHYKYRGMGKKYLKVSHMKR